MIPPAKGITRLSGGGTGVISSISVGKVVITVKKKRKKKANETIVKQGRLE